MSSDLSIAVALPRVRERLAATTHNRELALVGLGSLAAAATVAYATAVNPDAAPADPLGAVARAAYVLAPAAVGMYAWRRHPDERLGPLLIVFAFVAAIWTLNGSSDPALFGVARLVGVAVAPLYSYVVLSFPEGRLNSALERWVVLGGGLVMGLCWIPLVFITRQPVVATPLVRCVPTCPRNVFFAGSAPVLARTLELGVRFGFAALLGGVAVLLAMRLRSSTPPMRRMLTPVLVVSILYACALALYLAVQWTGSGAVAVSGWIVILTVPIIPVALFMGLVREELFIRLTLARLITALPGFRDSEQVRDALAAALKDDSLQICLWRAADGCYVDGHGAPLRLPEAGERTAVTKIERNGQPLAAIVHDSALADDSRFIRSIASAAMVGVEKTRLEADLQVSRRRLVRTADLTRERFERDLHDGAQQHLVALLMRLDLAAEAIETGSDDATAMVKQIGTDAQAALDELRQLARGMYPSLLASGGLEHALKAATLRTTLPATVRAQRIGRYAPDIEAAVYFCCVEALQNAAKHAGPDASISVRLWSEGRTLRFEVADTGVGFDQRLERSGTGLAHMRDRIGAVGGDALISSAAGRGTSVSGVITIAGNPTFETRSGAERPRSDPLVLPSVWVDGHSEDRVRDG